MNDSVYHSGRRTRNLGRSLRALTLWIPALALAASCSSPASLSAAATSGTDGAGGLPLQTRLLLGTLRLEGTDQAVTPDQAAQLWMLWKGVRSLSNSDNTAEVEMEALTHQIETAMTSDQLAAIDAMRLTTEDMRTAMKDLTPFTESGGDLASGGGGRVFQGGPPDGAAGGAPRGGAGGLPDGGFFPQGGQGQSLTPDQLATLEEGRESAGGTQLNLRLLQRLLDFLEMRSKQ